MYKLWYDFKLMTFLRFYSYKDLKSLGYEKHLKTLCKKCPNMSYLGWTRENPDQKKLRIWTLFTQWELLIMAEEYPELFQTSKLEHFPKIIND